MYKIVGADGKEYGPIPAEVLRQWIAEGRANALTKALPEGATEWKTLGEIPEFALALASAAAPALAPGPISAPQPVSRTNPLALSGLILGILSVTFACCCFGTPFNVAGIICSIIGLVQIHNDPRREQGKGLAIGGLVLCLLGILVGVLLRVVGGFGSSDLMKELHKL
jgi:hypothetical protein